MINWRAVAFWSNVLVSCSLLYAGERISLKVSRRSLMRRILWVRFFLDSGFGCLTARTELWRPSRAKGGRGLKLVWQSLLVWEVWKKEGELVSCETNCGAWTCCCSYHRTDVVLRWGLQGINLGLRALKVVMLSHKNCRCSFCSFCSSYKSSSAAGLFGELNIHDSYHQYRRFLSQCFQLYRWDYSDTLISFFFFNVILGIKHTWLLVPQMRRKLMMDSLQSKIEKWIILSKLTPKLPLQTHYTLI